MKGKDTRILDDLEELLQKSLAMEEVIRWKKYSDRGEARRENSLQHSYKASLLAKTILDNEIIYSPNIDRYLVLSATLVHDLGEIAVGDAVYIDKTEEKDKKEEDFFKKMISNLNPDLQKSFEEAYLLQNPERQKNSLAMAAKQKEINLFEAIERFGYVIFAYREFKENEKGEKIFVQTMRHQHRHLVRLAEELPGFGNVFYTPEIQKHVKEILKKYEGQFIEKKDE